jgi:hypothetical protein
MHFLIMRVGFETQGRANRTLPEPERWAVALVWVPVLAANGRGVLLWANCD